MYVTSRVKAPSHDRAKGGAAPIRTEAEIIALFLL